MSTVACLSCGERLQRNVAGQTTRFYVYRRTSDNASVTICPKCSVRLDLDTTCELRDVRTDVPPESGEQRARTTKCYWPRVKAAPAAQRSRWRVWLARIGFGLYCAGCVLMLLWVAALLFFVSVPAEGIFSH